MSTACTSCPSASPGRRASRSLWFQSITKFGGLGRTLETKEANPYLLEKVPGALGEKNFPVVSAITGLWLAAHIFPGGGSSTRLPWTSFSMHCTSLGEILSWGHQVLSV